MICGMLIGFICGFVGAGGGLMMLLILTSVLGYELKTAVGTSVFIMAFTAFTGAVSHFAMGGMPDITCLVLCVAVHVPVGKDCGTFCKQGKTGNVKPCNRSGTCDFGDCTDRI